MPPSPLSMSYVNRHGLLLAFTAFFLTGCGNDSEAAQNCLESRVAHHYNYNMKLDNATNGVYRFSSDKYKCFVRAANCEVECYDNAGNAI